MLISNTTITSLSNKILKSNLIGKLSMHTSFKEKSEIKYQNIIKGTKCEREGEKERRETESGSKGVGWGMGIEKKRIIWRVEEIWGKWVIRTYLKGLIC